MLGTLELQVKWCQASGFAVAYCVLSILPRDWPSRLRLADFRTFCEAATAGSRKLDPKLCHLAGALPMDAAAVPLDPVGLLQASHLARGLGIHARTACADWLGEPFDVTWAIDVLHPLAISARA